MRRGQAPSPSSLRRWRARRDRRLDQHHLVARRARPQPSETLAHPVADRREIMMVAGTAAQAPALEHGGMAVGDPPAPARFVSAGCRAIGKIGMAMVAEHLKHIARAEHAGAQALLLDIPGDGIGDALLTALGNHAERQRQDILDLEQAARPRFWHRSSGTSRSHRPNSACCMPPGLSRRAPGSGSHPAPRR